MTTDQLPDERTILAQDQDEDESGPYWTVRRVIFVLILLITLIAFLAYVLWPTVSYVPLPAPPLNVPMQRI